MLVAQWYKIRRDIPQFVEDIVSMSEMGRPTAWSGSIGKLNPVLCCTALFPFFLSFFLSLFLSFFFFLYLCVCLSCLSFPLPTSASISTFFSSQYVGFVILLQITTGLRKRQYYKPSRATVHFDQTHRSFFSSMLQSSFKKLPSFLHIKRLNSLHLNHSELIQL